MIGALLLVSALLGQTPSLSMSVYPHLQLENPDLRKCQEVIDSCTAQLSSVDPSSKKGLRLREQRADAYTKVKESQKALADYDAILKVSPSAEVYVKKAEELLHQNDTSAATLELENARRLNPNLASLYSSTGYLRHKQGRIADEVECYQKAIDLDPEGSYRCSWNLACIYASISDYPNALKFLDLAIQHQKDGQADPNQLYLKGTLLYSAQKFDESCSALLTAKRLAETMPKGSKAAEFEQKAAEDQVKNISDSLCHSYLSAKKPYECLSEAKAMSEIFAADVGCAKRRVAFVTWISNSLSEQIEGKDLQDKLATYLDQELENVIHERIDKKVVDNDLLYQIAQYFVSKRHFDRASTFVDMSLALGGDTFLSRGLKSALLSSSPIDSMRDGKQALAIAHDLVGEAAKMAYDDQRKPQAFIALAFAEAELGNFPAATNAIYEAALCPGAPESGATEFSKNLRLFESKRPYRFD